MKMLDLISETLTTIIEMVYSILGYFRKIVAQFRHNGKREHKEEYRDNNNEMNDDSLEEIFITNSFGNIEEFPTRTECREKLWENQLRSRQMLYGNYNIGGINNISFPESFRLRTVNVDES